MVRILIVEDDYDTCRQMSAFLAEMLLQDESEINPHIDSALSVREARTFIDEAFVTKKAYNAIILDFNLPIDSGYHPEVDESLCQLIRDRTPKTLVIHISAFTDDEMIQRHMKRCHLETIDRSFTLSKMDVGYASHLARKLKAFLYGNQIDERLQGLFETGKDPRLGRSATRRVSTYELAALSRDIVKHWRDLDDSTKERIKEVFYVDSSSDPVRISLL